MCSNPNPACISNSPAEIPQHNIPVRSGCCCSHHGFCSVQGAATLLAAHPGYSRALRNLERSSLELYLFMYMQAKVKTKNIMQASLSVFPVSHSFPVKGGVTVLICQCLKKVWTHSFMFLLHEGNKRAFLSFWVILCTKHLGALIALRLLLLHQLGWKLANRLLGSEDWQSPWPCNINFLPNDKPKVDEMALFCCNRLPGKEGAAGFVNWHSIARVKRSTSITGITEMKVSLSVTGWKMKPSPPIQHVVPLLGHSESYPLLPCTGFALA